MKLYKSKNWLYQKYVVERKTIYDMATEAGCSHMTIQNELTKHNLIRKPRSW